MVIKEYGYLKVPIDDDTVWVLIEIAGYTAYMSGDDYLIEALIEAGFKDDTKRT